MAFKATLVLSQTNHRAELFALKPVLATRLYKVTTNYKYVIHGLKGTCLFVFVAVCVCQCYTVISLIIQFELGHNFVVTLNLIKPLKPQKNE